jgi:predicted nucleic acid-binding protein
MAVAKAYLDNNVVCGVTKDDLPAGEPEALTELVRMHSEGKVRVVTSELTRKEMAAWKGKNRPPAERVFYLLEKVEFLPDHAVVGFHNQWDRTGGCSYPLAGDEPVVRSLLAIGLDRTDAHHLMLAIKHHCEYFVTCDKKDGA